MDFAILPIHDYDINFGFHSQGPCVRAGSSNPIGGFICGADQGDGAPLSLQWRSRD